MSSHAEYTFTIDTETPREFFRIFAKLVKCIVLVRREGGTSGRLHLCCEWRRTRRRSLPTCRGPKEETREDLVHGREAVRHWWHPECTPVDSNFWNHGIPRESIASAGAATFSFAYGLTEIARDHHSLLRGEHRGMWMREDGSWTRSLISRSTFDKAYKG